MLSFQAVTFFDAFVQSSDQTGTRPELKYFSFIKIFLFQTIKCMRCNTEYLTESDFVSHLLVNISTDGLGNAVRRYLDEKTQTTGCCYICHQHERGVTCTRPEITLPLEIQQHVLGFPRFINVLVKRNTLSATGRQVKDTRPQHLSAFDLDGVEYFPVAGLAHIGGSLKSGHFVAYVNRNSTWYGISDDMAPRELMDEPTNWLLCTYTRGANYAKGPSGPYVYDY